MKPQGRQGQKTVIFSTVAAAVLNLALRLVQRAVEWPVAVVFGMMLLFGLALGLGVSSGGVNVVSGLAFYVFLLPLEITRGAVTEINTEQALWLAGFWYVVYTIIIEIVSWLWRRRRPGRTWPVRWVTVAILAVGYTGIGIYAGFHTGDSGFRWSMLLVTWAAVAVAGACLLLSAGLEAASRALNRFLLRS
jgi:hypothetical protein